jgi:hypothetical protein
MSYNSSWVTTGYLNIPNVYSFSNTLNATVPFSWKSAMSTQSVFFSADISFDKYATLSVTGRHDKVSTLPEGKNGFFYPSVSLSTVISDYVKLPELISMLKVRASFADVKGALTKSQIGPAWFEMDANNPTGYGTGYYTSYGGPSYANQTIFTTAATYNNTSSDTTGDILKYRMQNIFKSDVQVSFRKRFATGFTGLYYGYMKNIDIAFYQLAGPGAMHSGIIEYRKEHNKGNFIIDYRVSYTISKFKLMLLVNNLFNTEYSTRPITVESPRVTTLKVLLNI